MPTDWNQAYENEDTPWDKGYASPPLGEFLRRQPVTGQVLVPGCGSGHDVRMLAEQGADVVGLDIAPSAIRKASAFPKAGAERYMVGDFLQPESCHLEAYDWVFEHTCLCALDPDARAGYAQALCRVLKKGGYFLAVFFREVADYTGDGPPHPISREAIKALFQIRFELMESRTPESFYPGRPRGTEELCWMRLR